MGVKIYPKQFLPSSYILRTRKKYTYGNFLKNKIITDLKNRSIFKVSILVLINILQYSLMSKNRYNSIFKKFKIKNFKKQFFTYILPDHVANFSISILEK